MDTLHNGVILHISSQCYFRWSHSDSLKSPMVGIFTPQKLANATNQYFFFPPREVVVKYLPGLNLSCWYFLIKFIKGVDDFGENHTIKILFGSLLFVYYLSKIFFPLIAWIHFLLIYTWQFIFWRYRWEKTMSTLAIFSSLSWSGINYSVMSVL